MDQPVGRHDTTCMEKEHCEECPLSLPTEGDQTVVALDLERAQYPELERHKRH